MLFPYKDTPTKLSICQWFSTHVNHSASDPSFLRSRTLKLYKNNVRMKKKN